MPEVYHGDGPYIFISYRHADAEIVMMEIEQFQKKGINVWYDEGLALGEPWDEVEVKNHIEKSNCIGVFFFVSPVFFQSRAVWKEVGYTKEAEKKYCIIMLDTSVKCFDESIDKVMHALFLDLEDQIDDAWRNSKTSETPMDKNTRRMLEDMFDEDRTYTSCYDASHIDRLFECYKRWSYDFRIDIFPLCNVLHNGHIEFFPSLLSATPYNFTIIAISTEYKHVEESLNNEGKQQLTWRKYSRSMFYASDIDESDVGIVICIPEKDIPWICEILDIRRQKYNRLPLIINIQVLDLNDVEQIIHRVKSQMLQWDKLSADLKSDDLNDLFVVQTTEQSSRPIESSLLNKVTIKGNEYWRVLISTKEYQDMLLSLLRDPNKSNQAQWLFSQLPISDDKFFQNKRKILMSDGALVEQFDRELFRNKKYEWEVASDV